MILILLACAPVVVDFEDPVDTGAAQGLPDGQWSLETPDDGFGGALHWDGARLYMSAPASGKLASVAGGSELKVEDIPVGAGTSLHTHQETFFPSQSLSEGGLGTLPDGSTGQGAAARSQASLGERWLALDGHGLWDEGEHRDLGLWGSALIVHQGAWIVGASQGPNALRLASGETIARPTPLDEAGAALSSCDLDLDGTAELAVGAPGAGLVYVYTALDDEPTVYGLGAGRFGHALSCGEAGLYVGAPMQDEGAGAVFLLSGPPQGATVEEVYTGAGHAGNAVLAVDDALFVSETGATAEDAGLVLRIF